MDAAAPPVPPGQRSAPVYPAQVPITSGSPVKRQRRKSLVALYVVVAVVCALGASAAVTQAGHRVSVLAVAKDVPAGQALTSDDLRMATVSADPALSTMSAASQASVVGKRTAVDLRAGQLLTRSDLSAGGGLGDDQQTVGVAIKRGQAPDGLAAGDQVLAVTTPAQGQQPGTQQPSAINATVVSIGLPDATGTAVVTLAVPSESGPTLAGRAAAGMISIVRQPRSGS